MDDDMNISMNLELTFGRFGIFGTEGKHAIALKYHLNVSRNIINFDNDYSSCDGFVRYCLAPLTRSEN